MTQPQFKLQIAGLAIDIAANDVALVEALRLRYAAFAARADTIGHVLVNIDHLGWSDVPPLLNIPPTFTDSVLQIDVPGYSVMIDVARHTASIVLECAHPLEAVEYALRMVVALLAFEHGGLMYHAAGVIRNDRAFLFFGYSGSGKTTVARVSTEDLVLNDDLLVLLPACDRWYAHATPFWNPTQIRPSGPHSAPVAALLRLVQAPSVRLEPMTPAQAVAECLSSIPVITADRSRSAAALLRATQLLNSVPHYRLHFLPDNSFWPILDRLGA